MQLSLVTTVMELESLAEAWRSLAGDAVFAGPDWLIPWWRHVGSRPAGDGRPPRLATLAVRDDAGELVAVAPWYLEESLLHGKKLRLLGSGDVCSDYLTIPCRSGAESAAVVAIAEWLLAEQRRTGIGWDLLGLEAIDLEDHLYSHLIAVLEDRGAIVSTRPAGNCWRVPLSGTWEEYVTTLSKTNRKRVRRLDRAFLQTGRAQVTLAKTPNELAAGFELLIDLHTKRWRSRGEAGIFARPGILDFHRDATRRLLAVGRLRLVSLEIDGRPAASEYCIRGGSTLYSYQSGLEPELLALEPGTILIVATIQQLLTRGYTGLDFLRGDEPYKLDWRAVRQPVHDVRIVPSGWNGRLRHSLWQAATSAKDLLRAGRDAVLSGK